MDENKEFEKQVEDAAEEIAEEVTEIAEEAAEGVVEELEEVAEDIEEAAEEITDEFADEAAEIMETVEELPKKKKNTGRVVAIIIAIAAVIVLAALTAQGKFPQIYNKYNHMGYVNITGRTIADIAKENDMELSELLEQYGLPADMPGNTQESAAYYNMPVKMVAQMYGMGFEDLKALLGIEEGITEDTPWGEAEGEVTLEKYIGADSLDSFKEEYGFGDEITGETKWKEVRNTVDNASKKKYEEQKAEEAAEEPEEEVPAEEPVEEEPAEEVAEE